MKNILIVGVGGRTGTLFGEELKRANRVFGVAGRHTLPKIKEGKVFVERSGDLVRFEVETLNKEEIPKLENVDAIFLATKNPVSPILKEYLPLIKNAKYIVLSQNGFKAGEEALETIKEVYGNIPQNLKIIRLVLFNAVKEIKDDSQIVISYKLPVRVAFGVFYGDEETDEFENALSDANIEYVKVRKNDVKNMEFSKLFTNLIGIPSYSLHLDIYEGLKNKEAFMEEVLALKEYIKVVKANKSRFLNFPHYPVKLFASLIEHIPVSVLVLFRNQIANLVLKLRGTKEKGNIDEIDYYTGAVVELARKLNIETPVNERVLRRIKNERNA